jgi:hypothetical protein
MAYRFDGVDDAIEFAFAPFSGYTFGPVTFAYYLKRNQNTALDVPVAFTRSALNGRLYTRFNPTKNELQVAGSGSTASAKSVDLTSLWYLIAVTWAGAGTVARHHIHDGTSWTHESPGSAITSAADATIARLFVGGWVAGAMLSADLVCAGIKKADSTDLQIEALSRTSFPAWTGFGFHWLAGFEAAGTIVNRAAPGSGNEISRVGTSLVADPPGWTWSAPTSGAMGKIKFGTGLTVTDEGSNVIRVDAAAATAGHVIADEGTALTQRATLDFAGAGVTVTDATPKTLVTIPGTDSGAELAYTQFTSNVTVTATSAAAAQTVVTAPAVTFDGATPVIVEFFAPLGSVNVAGGQLIFDLWDGSTDIGILTGFTAAGGGSAVPFPAVRKLTPTAGSHTYGIRAWTNAGTTATVLAGVGGVGAYVPGFIRITKA